jgi:hypothetical protein
MKPIQQTIYKCEICGHTYSNEKDALDCESQPISQDKGVKVGDKVLITNGDGKGELGTVETVYIIDKEWGHYAWKRYWHTVALTASLDKSYGHRMLTFDSYERVGVNV